MVLYNYKTAQQVGQAIVAVGAREGEGTKYISRCCRGGDYE